MLNPVDDSITTEELIELCEKAREIRNQMDELQAALDGVEDHIRYVIGLEDRLPGIGVFKRTPAYRAAIRSAYPGWPNTVPSYLGEDGDILYLYRCKQYISKATKLGVGRVGTGLILLDMFEHRRVKSAIRSDRNDNK